jgi:hypothetical protein
MTPGQEDDNLAALRQFLYGMLKTPKTTERKLTAKLLIKQCGTKRHGDGRGPEAFFNSPPPELK